ncbi:MAG: hypothetical protein IPM29_29260 [Planctomycetes bacterium]|nr:hypothetical protein [Planctomycetota bacterium]
MNDPTPGPRVFDRTSRDAALLALVALALFVAVRQSHFYLIDGETFYMLVARGQLRHYAHVLYLPIAGGVARVLGLAGVDLFDAMTVASALGAALAAFLAHRAAWLLGAPRGAALAVAAACAGAPACVFFATIIEVHGVFLAFGALAWLAVAVCARAPRAPAALALGATTGLAASVHATGHLLPLAAGLVLLAEVRALRAPRRLATFAICGALGHAAVWAAIVWLVGGSAGGSAHSSLDELTRRASLGMLAHFPLTVRDEWLLPFAPLSALTLTGLFLPHTRVLAIALHVALLPYLGAALVYLGPVIVENGAYLVPLAFPAAWLGLRVAGVRGVTVAAVCGLAIGLASVRAHDDRPPPGIAAADALALVDDRPAAFLVGSQNEAEDLLLHAPQLPVIRADVLVEQCAGLSEAASAQLFDGGVAAVGRAFVSDLALHLLRGLDHHLLRHIERSYELEPRRSGTFSGYELRRRR